MWNPTTRQWTTLASNNRMRIYHSVSMLLPDGTVLHGASGNAMAGAVPVPDQDNHEIFSPPYLFKFDPNHPGARPSITSAPANVGYGGPSPSPPRTLPRSPTCDGSGSARSPMLSTWARGPIR